MFRALFFLPLLGLCLATPLELEPLSDEEIFYINSVQSSWKAGRNFYPEDLENLKSLLGVDIEAENRMIEKLGIQASNAVVRNDLPKEFDPRKKWPKCKKSLNEIRDQSACGSDWALGPSEAMTDRICIHNDKQVHISAEDLNDCCKTCGNGCQEGFPSSSWEYYATKGVVSGGNYNSSEGCMPYTLPNCDHHHVKGKYKPCGGTHATPACIKSCRAGYPKTYEQDKNFGQLPVRIGSEEQIMQELVDNGPVSASFTVYTDFFSYKSGVYKHTTGQDWGGHAVKILGYGEENGEKYWLVANSWNEDWGDKGFFKIRRGTDECGIEDQCMAALPRV